MDSHIFAGVNNILCLGLIRVEIFLYRVSWCLRINFSCIVLFWRYSELSSYSSFLDVKISEYTSRNVYMQGKQWNNLFEINDDKYNQLCETWISLPRELLLILFIGIGSAFVLNVYLNTRREMYDVSVSCVLHLASSRCNILMVVPSRYSKYKLLALTLAQIRSNQNKSVLIDSRSCRESDSYLQRRRNILRVTENTCTSRENTKIIGNGRMNFARHYDHVKCVIMSVSNGLLTNSPGIKR